MNPDIVRMHVAQALTRAHSAAVRRHLRAALDELDSDIPPALQECPVCGVVGIAERIDRHDCVGGDADE